MGSRSETKEDREVFDREDKTRQQEIWYSPIPDDTRSKRGRLSSAERFRRERSNSEGSPITLWKRKFDEVDQQGEREPSELFKRSTLTRHSPSNRKEGQGQKIEIQQKIQRTTEEETEKEETRKEETKKEATKKEETKKEETKKEDSKKEEAEEKIEEMEEMFKRMLAGVKEEILGEVRKLSEKGEEGREEVKVEIKKLKEAVDRSRVECEEGRNKLEGRIEKLENDKHKREEEENERWERERENLDRRIEEGVNRAMEEIKRKAKTTEREPGQGPEEETRSRIKEVENTLERNERKEKRNNVIVKGLKVEKQKDPRAEVRAFLSRVAQKEIEVELVKEMRWNEKIMYLAKLREYEDKRTVMKNKGGLKGSQVFIDEDLTKKEREIQAGLVERMKREREMGKRAKVGYMKIWINNKELRWNEEKNELEERFFRDRSSEGSRKQTEEGGEAGGSK